MIKVIWSYCNTHRKIYANHAYTISILFTFACLGYAIIMVMFNVRIEVYALSKAESS